MWNIGVHACKTVSCIMNIAKYLKTTFLIEKELIWYFSGWDYAAAYTHAGAAAAYSHDAVAYMVIVRIRLTQSRWAEIGTELGNSLKQRSNLFLGKVFAANNSVAFITLIVHIVQLISVGMNHSQSLN